MSCRLLAATMLFVVSAHAGTNNAIVVSAPRLDNLDLMAVDTVANTTVIDRQTIEQSGAASVADLLRNEANVLVRGAAGDPTGGEISMRGFGENSGLRVLVLVDGHKMNRPDMGRIEWQNLPVSNIERIEVVRGGQNVLYGNHALSGVIKITTRRSTATGVQASGAIGSFGYIEGSAGYHGAAGDFDYHVGIQAYSYDGFRSNSASKATTASGSIGWYPNDTDVVTLRGSLGRSDVEFPGWLTYEQMQDDPTQSTNAAGTSTDWSGLASLLYETERVWGAARVNAGYNYRDRESDWDSSPIKSYSQIEISGFSFAPRVRYGSEESFLMGGFDFNHDGLDIERYLDAERDIVLAEGEFGRFTAAPYLFVQRTFVEKTVLNGGARYEHARTDNRYTEYVAEQLRPIIQTNRGPMPNPDYKNPPDVRADVSYDGIVKKQGWAAEIGLSHKLSERTDVWLGYDRVYRYPTLDETASYQGFPLADPLNKNLDPETGDNFEVGTRYGNRDWRVSLTGFYLMLDNEIVFDPEIALNGFSGLNVNMGSTRRLGTEAEVAWAKRWYGASTSWTLVDARINGGENDDNRVPLAPWATGVLSGWVEPVDPLRLTLFYTYVSEQYQGGDDENTERKMDAYGLLGFRVNIAMSKRTSLYVVMDNLLDETYATAAYSGAFYPGSGRSFRVGISAEL